MQYVRDKANLYCVNLPFYIFVFISVTTPSSAAILYILSDDYVYLAVMYMSFCCSFVMLWFGCFQMQNTREQTPSDAV